MRNANSDVNDEIRVQDKVVSEDSEKCFGYRELRCKRNVWFAVVVRNEEIKVKSKSVDETS